mmetsp:Transcript_4408/g.8908  ORF Transcript_4408/g.8908 Transcript_4408/m.8908 type:complete len:206 (+) Transcript_4408:1-618(+)
MIAEAAAMPAVAYVYSSALAEAADVRQNQVAGVEEDELQQLRSARIAIMKQEKEWRESGQGCLRELADEVEFMDVLQPRERGVVLVCDGNSDRRSQELLEVLEDLAKKHVEAQFCHLELENAGLLAHAVDLDEGVPVIFVLKHGKVVTSLPPSRIFALSSASSPTFRHNITSLLRRVGGIGSGENDADSDSGCESDDGNRHGRRR